MANYMSYLWREVPSDNCWRIQTTDPKIKSKTRFETYPQIFSSKYGFIPNLSILDIIFNLGPNSSNYLRRHFTDK